MALFTITNLTAGDIDFGSGTGTIARNGSKTVRYISPAMRAASTASQISITPTVSVVLATSGLTNSIAAYAVTEIVNPTTFPLARANDATLAAELIKLRNDVESLRAQVEALLPA